MEKVKEVTAESKAPASPQVEEQPKLPEQKDGPQVLSRSPAAESHAQPDGMPPATRASEMLASPEGKLGAPARARMGSMLQRQVGNTRVGRTLGAAVQTRRTVGSPDEEDAERATGEVGSTSSTTMIQRQSAGAAGATASAPAPAPGLTLTPHDDMVSASLLETLDRFENIPIDVVQRLPRGFIGPPAMVRVSVHAQYFINRPAAQAHYRAARRTARFRDISSALERRGELSVLEGSRGPRFSGRAVELGKASPEDIKAFVEEAIAQDIIRDYAIRRRAITARQDLIDLAPAVLQALIQRWMRETGIGVDCSGFVQQAAIRAREQERERISAINSITGMFGVPPIPLPPEISPVERSARSFRSGPRVRQPRDMRPGDAWVMAGGGHIRIVTAVREAVISGGTNTIEFDTAESSGGSTQPDPGPFARTWRTRSLTRFEPIRAVGHTARPRGGTFHRIP
ncbi:MAG TPA: hypothetical protein VFY26_13765 [Anaerolineales bacterium]|nr:hypothetical protein [Anaerolineales bacterium]